MNEEPQGSGAVGVGPDRSHLYRHFSDDQIERYLVFALELVEKLNPPDDLRLAVFNAAWGMQGMHYGEGPNVQRSPAMSMVRGNG